MNRRRIELFPELVPLMQPAYRQVTHCAVLEPKLASGLFVTKRERNDTDKLNLSFGASPILNVARGFG